MPGIRTGLRLRIAATIAGIVLVAVTGLGLAVHFLLVADRIGAARTSADQRIQAAVEIYDRTGLLSFDTRLDDPGVPAQLRDVVTRSGERGTLVEGGSTRTLWAAGRTGSHVLSTRTTFPVTDSSVRTADRALLAAGAVTVVLATLLGLLSANQLARRLRVAARTARAVAGGQDPRSLRAAVGARRDEVGDLADAVDAMAERLGDRLRGEQRFTADVAHDLRTPVTGLVTAAALLDDSRPAQLVRDRAAALTTLVEDLLEVSRLDRGVERALADRVDLGDVVARAVRRGLANGEYAEGEVVVQVDEQDVVVTTDARRLERVLSNLVRNGVQHGAPPVEVVQRGREITVRDHGAGFAAALLSEGPQRFRRTTTQRSDGNGLGLVIVAGQAAVLGAELELGNDPRGGASVRLVVPPEPPHEQVTDSSPRRDRTGRET